MLHSLIKITSREEKKKASLLLSIEKKRILLSEWMEKVESLRISLDLIKHEYNVRIGSLLLKDNQLDLEIIKYKNLKHLMEEGKTYDQAVRIEEDKFYNEILRMQEEQEKIEEEKELLENRAKISGEEEETIKSLWKKLIRKFHPDLSVGAKEKEEKEEIMKQINNAYAANDIETLRQFENEVYVQKSEETTIEQLEQILVETENMILLWQDKFRQLKQSEWFIWKIRREKLEKKNRQISEDVFAHLERKLLDDIVKKIEILKSLTSEMPASARDV